MKDWAAQFHRFHDKSRPVIDTLLYGRREPLSGRIPGGINWIYNVCYRAPSAGAFSLLALTLA